MQNTLTKGDYSRRKNLKNWFDESKINKKKKKVNVVVKFRLPRNYGWIGKKVGCLISVVLNNHQTIIVNISSDPPQSNVDSR